MYERDPDTRLLAEAAVQADEIYAAFMLEQALVSIGYASISPGELQRITMLKSQGSPVPFDPGPPRAFAEQLNLEALVDRAVEGRPASEDDRFITRTNLEIQQALAVELLDLLFGGNRGDASRRPKSPSP